MVLGQPIQPKKMDKNYCIFGDSITEASYVKIGWVDLLRQYLEDKYKDDINVFNLGVSGNTTGDILKRFSSEAASRNPTEIIFEVGINDTKDNDLKQFRTNLEELIKLAKESTSEVTFVGLFLGNWTGDDPFSEVRTESHNKILKEVAELKGCRFIDLQGKLAPEDFQDGLHPNDQGHRKMFEVIKGYF